MKKRLEGQVALITGAGSGIGRATALRLLKDGANVLAVDQNEKGLKETFNLIQPNMGKCEVETMDITKRDAPTLMVESCKRAFGKINILVNNAGIGNSKPLHQTDDEQLDNFIDVNLRALFRFARTAVDYMRCDGNGGVIINLASVFGLIGVPGSSIYSATKAAVVGLTQNMAADYGVYNIRVNAIAPGMILTPINKARFENNDFFRDLLLTSTPLGRVGSPEDIANAIGFLCSDEASFISGHVLAIDGGWSATKFRPFPETIHN